MNEKYYGSKTADFITELGVAIYIVALILGIVLSNQTQEVGSYITRTENVFVWGVAWTTWGSGFLLGSLLLGFGEVIRLLKKIADK